MLNSIGLENKGLGDFVANKLPGYIRLGAPVIISIAGEEPAEFGKIARELNGVKKIAALELNLSCPNIKYGSREGLIAQDEKATYAAVKAARKSTDMTIIAKLSPNVTKIVAIARAAESAGADAISLVNTFLGIAVDMNSRRPVLGNVTGGLSGPAIKPIALRMVREVYEKVDIPVIGMGGIMDYKDALEFILCGACAVQVGTANFVNPDTAFGIIKGIEKYMAGNKIQNIRQIIGKLGTA
jgi:dihydroorotate dehydrogenase (NAD+) catalytic subunit